MKNPGDYSGYLPSPDQEHLLRAALLQNQEGARSWKVWSDQVDDLHKLDYGSFRVLPLLYRNLTHQCIQHPLLLKLKGVYHSAWAKNQILFNKVLPVINTLQAHGIPVVGMKGLALTFQYYQDEGVRPMDDIDLLVRFENAPRAIKIVTDMGWTQESMYPNIFDEFYLLVKYALSFYKEGAEIDLHWYSLSTSFDHQRDALFLDRALEIEIKGTNLLVLQASDELFLNCIHGIRWNKMSPIRWIADAITILGKYPQLDWDEILFQATSRSLSKMLLTAITYLKATFDAPIPPEIIRALERNPASPQEKKELSALQSRPGWNSDLRILWVSYPRIRKGTQLRSGFPGIMKYFQIQWGLKSVWQVPSYVFIMGIKRILKFYSCGKSR